MLAPPPLPRTLEACLRDLGSAKADVRASAVADLVSHAGSDEKARATAVPLLEKALKDTASAVRAAAAMALADLVAHEALPSLLVAVEDEHPHVRQMALSALGEIGDARAAPRLKRALDDERPEVRYQAVIAYPRVADETDAALALVHAAADTDAQVRYIALRVAEERVSPREGEGCQKLVPAAERCLKDDEERVRVVAALLLAKLGSSKGREILVRIVRGEAKAEKEDEREVVEIIGELGLSELVPVLERRAWGLGGFFRDTCSFHAKIALARMGHARAIDEIGKDLASPKPDVRAAAVVAAGRARLKQFKDAVAALGPDAVDPSLRTDALVRLSLEDT